MNFRSPQFTGAVLLVMSVVSVGLNFLMIRYDGTYSAKLFMLACACVLVGPFIMVVGAPKVAETGKPPLWYQATSMALALVGVGAGFWLSKVLSQ
jgi:drug/metabolite transporter (DMT)-like permease